MADELADKVFEAVKSEFLQPLDQEFLGPKRFIYCYLPKGGGCPAREFLDSIATAARTSYTKLFQMHCAGHQLRGEKHRPWTEKGCGGLYEYKDNPSKTRLMHITDRQNTNRAALWL